MVERIKGGCHSSVVTLFDNSSATRCSRTERKTISVTGDTAHHRTVHLIPHQRWLRIIPVALLMYMISYVDRTNISMALPSLSRELRIDPAKPATSSAFFSGVICCFRSPPAM